MSPTGDSLAGQQARPHAWSLAVWDVDAACQCAGGPPSGVDPCTAVSASAAMAKTDQTAVISLRTSTASCKESDVSRRMRPPTLRQAKPEGVVLVVMAPNRAKLPVELGGSSWF